MKKRFLTILILLPFIAGALYAGFTIINNKDVETTLMISLPTPPPATPVQQTVYIEVPKGDYDKEFAIKLGETEWKTAKNLYRQKAGLVKFIPGDIFVMKRWMGKVHRFSLHHYANRTTGKEIIFKKFRGQFVKSEKRITLIVKTMTKYYPVHTSFQEEYSKFYKTAKPRMLWDWGVLDMLQPNDSIVFMLKGIFDGDMLVHLYGILGFAVKSETIGDFTLALYRNGLYGDYFAADTSKFLSPSGFFRTPVDYAKMSSPFGYRKDPFTRRKKFHNGVDVIAKVGTPIHAAQDGKVIFAGRKGGFGKTIILQHKDGFKTLYAHCNSLLFSPGAEVRMGNTIALVGNTGRSTASHLHFSVYKDGKAVNPFTYTYERSWATPFDIGNDFKRSSIKRASLMLKSLDYHRSFFNNSAFALNKTLYNGN
ncbi:M23 family metallopeptidase [bacterium]|nr:M23 family metallopeptidase [bacterium]